MLYSDHDIQSLKKKCKNEFGFLENWINSFSLMDLLSIIQKRTAYYSPIQERTQTITFILTPKIELFVQKMLSDI